MADDPAVRYLSGIEADAAVRRIREGQGQGQGQGQGHAREGVTRSEAWANLELAPLRPSWTDPAPARPRDWRQHGMPPARAPRAWPSILLAVFLGVAGALLLVIWGT